MTSLIGIGTAVPQHSFSQEECLDHALKFAKYDSREELLFKKLYKKTQIGQRGSCIAERAGANTVTSSFFRSPLTDSDHGPTTEERMRQYVRFSNELSLISSREAISDSGIAPEEITHLITVSCTGFDAPGFDLHLARELQLSPGVFRTHIGFMGCHGTMNALRVADAFVSSSPEARVLLCSTEICSVHFQYGKNRSDIVSNALFADGSAGIVLANLEGKFHYRDSKSIILPNSLDAMQWHIGNFGFKMSLSADVPDLISKHLKSTLREWLSSNSLLIGDVKSWAVHPGGPRILDTVERSLDLPVGSTTASRQVLLQHGNMSSATVPFILKELLIGSAPLPCVVMAFGPGLTIEAALLS